MTDTARYTSPKDAKGYRRWSEHAPKCHCDGRGYVEHPDGTFTECVYEWCAQCGGPRLHASNRCPVGEDVRCLTHERWMKRGTLDCTNEFGTPPPDSRPCVAAS